MGRRFRPTPSKIVERRRQGNERTSSVDIDLSQIDTEYLDKFLGRIFFWSFTIGKIKPHMHTTKFRVVTHRHIPVRKLISLVEETFPDGCRVTPVRGYNFRHTFDVKTASPWRWDDFIWRVTRALEGVL